jgi:hypothetical protein
MVSMRINIKFQFLERFMAVAISEAKPTKCDLSVQFAATR